MALYRVSEFDHLKVGRGKRAGLAGPGETVRLTREQAERINRRNPGTVNAVGSEPQPKAEPRSRPPGRYRLNPRAHGLPTADKE